MTGASGRSGTPEFARNRPIVLAASRVCGICGHDGAETVDHIVSAPDWPKLAGGRLAPGFDALPNLQPAHGSLGNSGLVNYCGECGRACNQSKGARSGAKRPQSRDWFGPSIRA